MVLGHCVISRYVLERTAWVRIRGRGLLTTMAEWSKVWTMFGTVNKGNNIVNKADKQYWKRLVKFIKKPFGIRPEELMDENGWRASDVYLMSVADLRREGGWTTRVMNSLTGAAWEQSVWWTAAATIKAGMARMVGVLRGAHPVDEREFFGFCAAGLTHVSNECPLQPEKGDKKGHYLMCGQVSGRGIAYLRALSSPHAPSPADRRARPDPRREGGARLPQRVAEQDARPAGPAEGALLGGGSEAQGVPRRPDPRWGPAGPQ